MAEISEARIQDMIRGLGESIFQKMDELAHRNDKKIDGITSALEGLQSVTRRGFQGVEDTLGKVTRDQSILNDSVAMLPRETQKIMATSIAQIVQAEVSKAIAAQMPKIIEAVQQQLRNAPQNGEKESAAQSIPTDKPAGERYADDEMVERPMPVGFRKKLQTMAHAAQSGAASKKEIFQTETGTVYKTANNSLIREDELKSGAVAYDIISKEGGAHGLMESDKVVKKATYRNNGQSSYAVVGHRANVVDRLDEKDKDGKGLTLEEKKEIVRQYRQEHPKAGGR